MAKHYFWLKLPNDFFRQKEIKKLRKIAGGDTYTIIYLKMLLSSLKNEGKLYYEGVENNFVEELALDIDEETENVNITVAYLQAQGLLVPVSEDENMLTACNEMIGKESESAPRVREHRKQKALQCNGNVTNCNTEIELEKELELNTEKHIEIDSISTKPIRHKHGEYENVLLTDEDFEKLKTEAPNDWKDYIERLSSYMASTGKSYKNHLATMRNWIRKDKKGESNGQNKQADKPADPRFANLSSARNWAEE